MRPDIYPAVNLPIRQTTPVTVAAPNGQPARRNWGLAAGVLAVVGLYTVALGALFLLGFTMLIVCSHLSSSTVAELSEVLNKF